MVYLGDDKTISFELVKSVESNTLKKQEGIVHAIEVIKDKILGKEFSIKNITDLIYEAILNHFGRSVAKAEINRVRPT